MALEKDNKGHREMSDKLDEKYKDSNVWNKVIDLLFLIIFSYASSSTLYPCQSVGGS